MTIGGFVRSVGKVQFRPFRVQPCTASQDDLGFRALGETWSSEEMEWTKACKLRCQALNAAGSMLPSSLHRGQSPWPVPSSSARHRPVTDNRASLRAHFLRKGLTPLRTSFWAFSCCRRGWMPCSWMTGSLRSATYDGRRGVQAFCCSGTSRSIINCTGSTIGG